MRNNTTLQDKVTEEVRVKKANRKLGKCRNGKTHNHSQRSTGKVWSPKVHSIRRTQSFDTMPRMKKKPTICQPMAVQRRLAVSQWKVRFRYREQHMTLICLALISFTSMLAMSIIAPFFPIEATAKGMSQSVNGLVFSVYSMVLMVFSPVMSVTIPVIGSKLTLILGVFVAGIANILFGLLDKIDDLNTFTVYCFVVRAFVAMGVTAFSTASYTILMEQFSNKIGTAFVRLVNTAHR